MDKSSILYLVIPCYNEQEVLQETCRRLTDKLSEMVGENLISEKSRMVFVNDGSNDDTWNIIQELHKNNKFVFGINLSRNRGHQNALLAGLLTVKPYCDITISLDADLQDDIEVLNEFVQKHNEGCEIVYGVRNSRKKDSFFKRFTAQGFYKFMSFMGAEVVYNHADYRLMSRKVMEGLESFKEVNLFLRGIVPMIGYKSGVVEYERNERFAGESKYPLKKMISFALNGITSLSIKPIRFITSLGCILFTLSIVMLIYYIVGYFSGNTIAGWASLVTSIWGIGGLQLLAIGIIGEYIGKIYLETKERPKFIIQDFISEKEK